MRLAECGVIRVAGGVVVTEGWMLKAAPRAPNTQADDHGPIERTWHRARAPPDALGAPAHRMRARHRVSQTPARERAERL